MDCFAIRKDCRLAGRSASGRASLCTFRRIWIICASACRVILGAWPRHLRRYVFGTTRVAFVVTSTCWFVRNLSHGILVWLISSAAPQYR